MLPIEGQLFLIIFELPKFTTTPHIGDIDYTVDES